MFRHATLRRYATPFDASVMDNVALSTLISAPRDAYTRAARASAFCAAALRERAARAYVPCRARATRCLPPPRRCMLR